jgi:hypothetical protein
MKIIKREFPHPQKEQSKMITLQVEVFNFYYPLYKNLITFHGTANVKNENV